MQCSVEGCERESMYTAREICQMHYFRWMRNGHYGLSRIPMGRFENPAGYQLVHRPGHPLAGKSGYVLEHRMIVYDDIGPAPMDCELCGVSLTWRSCRVDHIDNDVRNNLRSNLRPTCNTCNTRRGMQPPVEWPRTTKILFQGEKKTAAEWGRDSRVKVTGATIICRKNKGASDEEALFGAKKTHNGNRNPRLGTGTKHYRLRIDGQSKNLMEWSRAPGCEVTSRAISLRLAKGWTPRDAVFAPQGNRGQTRC